jgi:putrescine:ornithine antiporter
MSIGAGVGSSISLTLWAFLGNGIHSAELGCGRDPKRNVPLACLFGTLARPSYTFCRDGHQGIVPNRS